MSGHDSESGSNRISKLVLKYIYLRFVVLMCFVLSRNHQMTSNQFSWNNKMFENFWLKIGTLICVPEGPFDLHSLLFSRGLGHVAKVFLYDKVWKGKNSLLKKIFSDSGGCDMGMKMWRKHISCWRLGSEIALNLLSEQKLLVS